MLARILPIAQNCAIQAMKMAAIPLSINGSSSSKEWYIINWTLANAFPDSKKVFLRCLLKMESRMQNLDRDPVLDLSRNWKGFASSELLHLHSTSTVLTLFEHHLHSLCATLTVDIRHSSKLWACNSWHAARLLNIINSRPFNPQLSLPFPYNPFVSWPEVGVPVVTKLRVVKQAISREREW